MNNVSVKAENISLRYYVGSFRDVGLKEYIINKIKKQNMLKEIWAVDDISFELEKGDLLGIIGTNGSGKSTLLKAVSGVLQPQKGNVELHGRVSSLLELGTGFDGDLTIKENIYFRGALLGYTEEFMDQKYKDIISFSELEEFQHYKLKQLSSGMKSRLAFSIASLIDPDVLILDEVLAVGDGAFRAKSEKKMLEIIKNGTTTLFVSHSVSQIKKLANKALWLNKGKQMAFGETKKVCAEYERYLKTLTK